ncbi:response regulator [Cellulophaga baltica]|uniref:response regulator n=1 Tax=Cellulophaga TaxID=104264 RepID=UPI001C07C364|nr:MULTISPECIES: response regulator [Cellulophaga]MBU2996977.1 response regulator [Cellulophaga baltica]MDO6768375.1 response regulator [Cellulophaga sp. 1_MG-2023]
MGKENVLIVDDDEIYLYLIQRVLRELSNGVEIYTSTDGEQALDFIRKCDEDKQLAPKVILLDVNMPFLDGWGFLDEFKKLKVNFDDKIFIYLVTSSEMPADKKRALEYEELTGYIVKPISEKKLSGMLTEVFSEMRTQ